MSRDDSEALSRLKKFHDDCKNVAPTLGWGGNLVATNPMVTYAAPVAGSQAYTSASLNI